MAVKVRFGGKPSGSGDIELRIMQREGNSGNRFKVVSAAKLVLTRSSMPLNTLHRFSLQQPLQVAAGEAVGAVAGEVATARGAAGTGVAGATANAPPVTSQTESESRVVQARPPPRKVSLMMTDDK